MDEKPWDDGGEEGPSLEAVERDYLGIFGAPSVVDEEVVEERPTIDALSDPIGVEEISRVLGNMRSDAVGPDGIKPSQLKRIAPIRLVILFNFMVFFGIVPDHLKKNRTILIPKGGDLNEVGNWLPITISSAVIRLLPKVLAGRFTQMLHLHKNQRGFRRVDGVVLNTLTLQALVKTKRTNLQPYHLLALDLRKAFDTVSHDSVARALRRFGVGKMLTSFILEGYNGSTTTITCKGGQGTVDI